MARLSDAILERLERSGLRGRGGGWYPAALKWRAVRAEGGDPVVIANGAEGEPGSIKDRYLMRARPAQIVAGLRAAAGAVGAREGLFYLKGTFTREQAALQAAIDATAGIPIGVHLGDDSYIAGEETALLESLEGRKPWPRAKPPRPSAVGLKGRPTLVQNVETLAHVPAAIADPDGFRNDERTWISLWGEVGKPGAYEVKLGTPIRAVVESFGGGAPDGIGMVFPGGPSSPPLGPEDLDVPLDPAALRERGSSIGTGAMLIVGASACPLALISAAAAFFERESCGQCPPCAVGSSSLARIIRGLESGPGRRKSLADAAGVAAFMADHGYCAHSPAAARGAMASLERFAGAVEEHLAAGTCPGGSATPDPFTPGSAALLAVESELEACVAASASERPA